MMSLKKILLVLVQLFSIAALNSQTVSDSVCAGDSSVVKYFVSNVQPGTTYAWTLNGGGNIVFTTNDTLGVSWNPIPGIYEVSVSGTNEEGCISSTDVYKIKVIELPNLIINPSSSTICLGEPVSLSVSGGANYAWTPATGLSSTTGNTVIANPTETTSYTVSGSSGTCSNSATVTVNVNRSPIAGFSVNQTGNYFIQCENTTSNGTTYFWDFGSGNTSTEENPIASFPFEGTYSVTLISTNSCGSDTLTQDVILLKLGLNELTGTSVSFGPNPFQDRLMLSLSLTNPEPILLSICDLLGKVMYQELLPAQKERLHPLYLPDLSSGMYLMRLSKGDETRAFKLVKQR
jgi:PKD repeat protein